MRSAPVAALLALALTLCACATTQRIDAAGDIGRLLVAVRDGDREGFEAYVDRPALKTNLRARLLTATAERYGPTSRQALGALAIGPLVDVAVDALVRPQVFRAAAELAGYGPQTRIPGGFLLSRGVRSLGDDRVCALIKGRCAFIFRREGDRWRMIDFEGDLDLLRR